MAPKRLAAPKAANRLSRIIEAFSAAHQTPRFPVDVENLARGVHTVFGWNDPITEVRAANIKGFEGCLLPNSDRSEWMLLFNNAMQSPGRIRFTQAHELGHYILHRLEHDGMKCTESDMRNWSKDEVDIEGQADIFSSYLLMPLDHYRSQIGDEVSFDAFGMCAGLYGVSLTAAVLKWLDYTMDKALLVYSTDGFINWACCSEPALKAGAYIKTKGLVVPLPAGSLAADASVRQDRTGRNIKARVWFPHAAEDMHLVEMKLNAERLGAIFTILHLPHGASVWPPRTMENEEQ